MERSKRRCAISLHDVEKCTRPNCSSLTFWAKTSWAPDNHAAAAIAAIALDAPMLMVSSSLEVPQVLLIERIAHLSSARDCCAAGFRPGGYPLWVRTRHHPSPSQCPLCPSKQTYISVCPDI